MSAVVHGCFGLNLFLSAVWIDAMSGFTSSPQQCAQISPDCATDERKYNQKMSSCDSDEHNLCFSGPCMEGHDKAPIVLVHGIFGFGEQVSLYISLRIFCSCSWLHVLMPTLSGYQVFHYTNLNIPC